MKPSPKTSKILLWLVPVLIILAAVSFKLIVDGKKTVQPDLPPIPVRTIQPERRTLTRTLKLNAHVESESMVTVLPLVSGILQEIFVEVGQKVRKDQIIARIDSSRYILQFQQAEAAYFSAKSSYERVAQLYNAGATTQQNYDQAKGQYEAYSSQYELARLQLNYANVKSPVNGVVLMKHLSMGSIAAPERPLVTIGDLSDLVVKAKIPESYYAVILKNQKTIPISIVDAGGERYSCVIRSISPFVSADTKNFETVISIQGDNKALLPGMFVAIEFELESWKDVLCLPFQSISGGNTLWYVQEGRAKSLEFVPKASSDEYFAVPEEYASREFLVEGQYFVSENIPVSVIGEGSAQ